MTARQLGTLFITNIKLALQYVGRWCMNLEALFGLYATFNVGPYALVFRRRLLCKEKFHIDLHSGKNPQFSEISTCTNYFCIGRDDRKKANTHYRGGGGG